MEYEPDVGVEQHVVAAAGLELDDRPGRAAQLVAVGARRAAQQRRRTRSARRRLQRDAPPIEAPISTSSPGWSASSRRTIAGSVSARV